MGDKQGLSLEYLKELRVAVESSSERHKLVGLAVYLGSTLARKDGTPKGYFGGRRDTNSRIYEAEHIANAYSKILGMLKQKSPEKVIETQEKKAKSLKKEDLEESPLSKILSRLNLPYQELGRRIEATFESATEKREERYKEYRETGDDRVLSTLLLFEEETMRGAIDPSSTRL